jgi:nucleoside-diphosphate-sugar epimerase
VNECKPLGQVPFEESTTPVPEDPYGIAKYAAELDLRAARDMFGLDFIVVRRCSLSVSKPELKARLVPAL